MKHPFILSAMLGVLCSLSASPTLKDTFKNDFLMGAALSESGFTEKDATKTALIKKQFNTITPENALKWGAVHPEPDRFNFTSADRYVEFGVTNGMVVIGHTLVWHNQTPAWVFQDAHGQPLDRDGLLSRMSNHIQTVVGRYRGRIHGWDVVNEALNKDGTLRQSPWLKIIGPDYIAKAFAFAHAADPNAELYYNDYGIENPDKRAGALALIKRLQAEGIPITGIGIQTHAKLEWPSPQLVDETLTAFGELGVKIMITELDVDVLPAVIRDQSAEVRPSAALDPALNPYPKSLPPAVQDKQAARYAELFAVFVKHADKISRVTFWGVTDGDSWLNSRPMRGRTNYPLLFDRASQPKPAFDKVILTGQPHGFRN